MAWSKKEQEQREREKPTEFSDELWLVICDRLSDGQSLRKICEDPEMPSKTSVFRWLRDNKKLSDQYARAKEESADSFAEDMLEIAREADVKNGNAVQRARLEIDTMKWLMSKQKPKKYGDKLDLTSDGKALPTPIYGGKSGESTKD